MFKELFIGPREMLVLILDGFLFAHSCKELVVRLGFLQPETIVNNEYDLTKRRDSRRDWLSLFFPRQLLDQTPC